MSNRSKGHDAERYYAKIFKEELGYKNCVTSRYGSRFHDDCGIDLINIPFNIQIKAGFQKGLNPTKTLLEIKNRIKEKLPQETNKPLILIHKKPAKSKKRIEEEEIVSMTFKTFKKLIKNNKI